MGAPSPICQRVAKALSQGEVALLPTDGLYMALVSARHCDSQSKLDEICGPVQDGQGLFAFIEAIEALEGWGITLPKTATSIANAFWPGPLSFHLPADATSSLPDAFRGQVLELCCAKQSFLRDVMAALAQLDEHPAAQMLVGRPAHRSGQLPVSSGTWLPSALGVQETHDLLDKAAFVIDAGPTATGCLPSAIGVHNETLSLLREGPISKEDLEKTSESPLTLEVTGSPFEHGGLTLLPADPPTQGLMPVQELANDAWAIGVGPRPKNCPHERWIELYEAPEAFIGEFYDALATAKDAGATTVYLRVPDDTLAAHLGVAQASPSKAGSQ